MEACGVFLAVPPMILLCISAVRELRSLTETITTADKTLLGLLSHVERMRLLMDTLRGLSTQLQNFKTTSVILEFEETAYYDTLNSICDLVRQVCKHAGTPWVMKAYWVTQRYKAVALLQMLRDHERQLGLCLQIMSMQSNLATDQDVRYISDSIAKQCHIQDKYCSVEEDADPDFADDETLVDETIVQANGSSQLLPMWPGYTVHTGHSQAYLDDRERLSTSAYRGDWTTVLAVVHKGQKIHDELWGAAVRIKPESQAHEISFWTPLHQAAALGAPVSVVQDLISAGALRTLRTQWAEEIFQHHQLTPCELAAQMGHKGLAAALAPIIHHPRPHAVLQALERQFHDMIRQDWRDAPWLRFLVLPQLEVLTELEVPEMWFPIQGRMGYQFSLDSRDLVVKKIGFGDPSSSLFRLTQHGAQALKRAVVFHR